MCAIFKQRIFKMPLSREQNSRVSDQKSVSPLYIMLEIHHSGLQPSKYSLADTCTSHIHSHLSHIMLSKKLSEYLDLCLKEIGVLSAMETSKNVRQDMVYQTLKCIGISPGTSSI